MTHYYPICTSNRPGRDAANERVRCKLIRGHKGAHVGRAMLYDQHKGMICADVRTRWTHDKRYIFDDRVH